MRREGGGGGSAHATDEQGDAWAVSWLLFGFYTLPGPADILKFGPPCLHIGEHGKAGLFTSVFFAKSRKITFLTRLGAGMGPLPQCGADNGA